MLRRRRVRGLAAYHGNRRRVPDPEDQVSRYTAVTPADLDAMLQTIGAGSIDELFEQIARLGRVAEPHLDHPALAVRVVVDRLG